MNRGRPFVAEAIIEYLRKEGAVSSSDGVETSVQKLAEPLGFYVSAVSRNLKKLIDLGIVVLKYGAYKQGNRKPKSLALAEGHEQGDEWKRVFFGERYSSQPKVPSSPSPKKLAKLTSDSTSLINQLLQAKLQINELQQKVVGLQQKVIDVQTERNKAYDNLLRLETRIKGLEKDSRLNSESARRSQEELVKLEFQLREAMSKANQFDRQILKNDERAKAFAHR